MSLIEDAGHEEVGESRREVDKRIFKLASKGEMSKMKG